MTTRREALKSISMLPVVASLDWTQPALDRAQGFVKELAALDTTAPAYAPKFFSAHEWKSLRMIADLIIPKDEHSGSATDAKAPEFIDFMMMDKETSENSKTQMRGCLAWMDNESRRRFGVDFIAATDAQHREIFDDVAYPKKAKPEMARGVAVFNRLRDSIASAFYSSAMGWQDLRYIGNVFNPNWNGCPPAATQKLGVSYDEYDASLKSQRTKRGA